MQARRLPGDLTPSPTRRSSPRQSSGTSFAARCKEQEQDLRKQSEDVPDGVGDGEFPGFLSRAGNEHFEKLYADSAARIAKLARMQEESLKQESDRDKKAMRPAKKGTKDDLLDACNRLYGEAGERRERMARKKAEQQYLEDLDEALRIGSRCRSSPSLVKNGESRWDRLHANGAERDKRLEERKLQRAEHEQKLLHDKSVHSQAKASHEPASRRAFDRLYNDGIERDWRRSQRKRLDAEQSQQELEQASVHKRSTRTTSETAEEAAERLYLEGQLRRRRQEAQKKLKEEKELAAMKKTASAKQVAKRVDLLYKDAARRTKDREWMQEEWEKEQLEEFLKQSVHATVREHAASETDRIFEQTRRDQPPQQAPRSARTPQRARSDFALVRPATARRSAPGDLDDEPMPEDPHRSITPQRFQMHRNGSMPGKLMGGRSSQGLPSERHRDSARDGFAPFSQMSHAPDPEAKDRPKTPVRKVASPPHSQRASGPFIMTHLVEEGARQALSAALPHA